MPFRHSRPTAGAALIAAVAVVALPALSARLSPDAATLRRTADTCVAQKQFSRAAECYRQAATMYRRLGDAGAAKVLETYAHRYESNVALYHARPSDAARLRSLYTGRRLEPVYGAYLGAFIDREDGVEGRYLDENGQLHKDSAEFNRRIGRTHATFFMYQSYGRRFPRRWTDHLKRSRAAAQLVLSPRSLHEVQDDAYLRGFAREARASGVPIFLRFAGEMNGTWVPYNGAPKLYIEKFRLVARVFHEEAPNVAMVWCPNDAPEDKIDRYFPGDEAVDWVGVNFYSVYYHHDDPSQLGWWRCPADNLEYIYKTYSARHPVMIGETAASHMGRADMQRRTDFAITKIGQLYSALPRLYPRVKAVHWLSMNNLKHAMPGRQLNNYSLLDEPAIAAQYASAVASPYFLNRVPAGQPAVARTEIVRLADGTMLSGTVGLSVWARCYEERPTVVYYVGSRKMAESRDPGAHEWELDTRQVPNGPAVLRAEVRDSAGKLACQQTVRVVIRN